MKESTKLRALNETKALVQSYGYSGFTFQQVAERLQIRQPSLYQHFDSKEDLGLQVIENAIEKFKEWTEVTRVFDPKSKIIALFENFYQFSSNHKICPLSSLISDQNSLSKTMQRSLQRLLDIQYSWLNEVIREGQKVRSFRKDKTSKALTNYVLSIAFGSQLLSRAMGDPSKIREMKDLILESISA